MSPFQAGRFRRYESVRKKNAEAALRQSQDGLKRAMVSEKVVDCISSILAREKSKNNFHGMIEKLVGRRAPDVQ